MLLASASDGDNGFHCSEHASLSVGGIIVVCWENIEYIDTESIIYTRIEESNRKAQAKGIA